MHGNAWNKQVMISESRRADLVEERCGKQYLVIRAFHLAQPGEPIPVATFPSIEHKKSSIYGAAGSLGWGRLVGCRGACAKRLIFGFGDLASARL